MPVLQTLSPLAESIIARMSAMPEFEKLLAAAEDGRPVTVTQMRGGAAALAGAISAQARRRPVLLVTTTLDRAEALADGLRFFGTPAMLFPAFETLPFELVEPALHIASQRGLTLAALASASGERLRDEHAPPVVVATADALMHRILPGDELRALCVDIAWGEPLDPDALPARLASMGYTRESMVESPGEFAVRGSIIDIYPADATTPWRLDFFGDEIESIRTFDPGTQRSLPLDREIEHIRILPRAQISPTFEHLAAGGSLADLPSLLPDDTLLIMDGPERIGQRAGYFGEVAARHMAELRHRSEAEPEAENPNPFATGGVSPADWILTGDELLASLRRFPRITWADLESETDEDTEKASEDSADRPEVAPARGGRKGVTVALKAQNFESVRPDYRNFLELIEQKHHGGYLTVIVCDNNGQAMRMDELLNELQISSVIIGEPEEGGPPARRWSTRDVAIVTGDLHEGFICPPARLLVLTDREIFGRYKRRRVYRKAFSGRHIQTTTEIQRGDYVVHAECGIGLFEGLRRQTIGGAVVELLELTYQDGDKLLVPVDKLHLVQKYASADGATPAPDKLGRKSWARKKTKSREIVMKLAGELLELYARREAAEGNVYQADNAMQREFEASFLHEETPDQLRAIQDVKRDMESPKPMDRLICGDVGYGKTEVAIRAAFKALNNGLQVAVLVPTTLLAQQHFQTFRERLVNYPWNVEILSRFQSPAEIKATLARLATGDVHLVIGTHRILSRDVKFKKLGLLIVDEEQRFGVAQKERIKSMKASVDVLTLTATPIPRTLHMALAHLRDLSIIQTPPADRLPIRTRTIQFERDYIEEAILRELNRGGQVFFVHNRIESIDEVTQSIRDIVPRARIAVGHGRMDEEELEQVMIDFIAGKYDILVATTIIENGIDIPNVNTIIINRADAMGLAQLYQLRGRVGRDVRQAYAYLIVPQGRAITDTAVKRLEALEEFTELGMGFSIAMRDMEIRGAGNILGGQQHGAIADIGFEMYCKLLEEAVQELRGEAPADPPFPVDIRWPADQWLPEEFVPIESQRIRIYKDLASARDLGRVDELHEELRDRYGEIPAETLNLLNGARIRVALEPWHVETVRPGAGASIRLHAREFARPLGEALARLKREFEWIDRISIRRADENVIIYHTGPATIEADDAKDAAGPNGRSAGRASGRKTPGGNASGAKSSGASGADPSSKAAAENLASLASLIRRLPPEPPEETPAEP